jgi:orotate phosphoribosyltransferase
MIDWSTIGESRERTALLGRILATLVREKLQADQVDAVYGLTVNGVPLAQEVATDLGKPCVIVKTQGELEFISPFFDPEGKRVILVDHVVATGRSLASVIEGLKETGTTPLATFVFVDKRAWNKNEDVAGVPIHSLVRSIRA